MGHPLEIVPVSAGAPMPGATMAVRLLFRGRPVADAKLHAGVVPHATEGELNALAGKEQHVELMTNAQGVAQVPISGPGLWNVRTIQIVEADRGSGADWDTHWATLVFSVDARAPGPR